MFAVFTINNIDDLTHQVVFYGFVDSIHQAGHLDVFWSKLSSNIQACVYQLERQIDINFGFGDQKALPLTGWTREKRSAWVQPALI